jgi:phosphopantetheine adenylyltransferase
VTVDLAKAEDQQLIRDLRNKTDVGVEKALVQINRHIGPALK